MLNITTIGLDGFPGEVRLGRACARALALEPFPLKSGDDPGAEVEWADELELKLAHLAGEGTERDYMLAHIVGFLTEAELAPGLARAGDDHKWALSRRGSRASHHGTARLVRGRRSALAQP